MEGFVVDAIKESAKINILAVHLQGM